MFKTAATKIAHNSTIPALSGNQELRPLQDLITAEKAVLISLQRLSVDFSKAAEALRTWGLCEGDDLGDILSASTTVLNHFSNALSQYATHGHAIREHLKTIRTREENLDEVKRRRRAVFKKADDADRKLNKMNPEHKNLQIQVDTLNRLRDEIRTLDTDIMIEEAALGDFKRTATRMWMGLKFGGLMECCQKGRIAATFGEMIISEISEEQTQPGLHRTFYQGQAKTEALVADAHRAVNEITLSTIPSIGFRDRQVYYGGRDVGAASFLSDKPMPNVPRDSSDVSPPPSRPYTNDVPSPPSSLSQKPYAWYPNDDRSGISRPYATEAPAPSSPSSMSRRNPPRSYSNDSTTVPPERSSADDFGVYRRQITSPLLDRAPSGSRFATFPVNSRTSGNSNLTLLDPLPIQSRHDLGPSFSSSIAEAFDHSGIPFENTNGSLPKSNTPALPPLNVVATPPPTATSTNPWAEPAQDMRANGRTPRSNTVDTEAAVLAYMMSTDEEIGGDGPPTSSFQGSNSVVTPEDGIRQLRIGSESEVGLEATKRSSFGRDDDLLQRPTIPPINLDSFHDRETEPLKEHGPSPGLRASEVSIKPIVEIWPSQGSPEVNEKELDAAAAREIALELDSVNNESEELSERLSVESPVERGRMSEGHGDYETISRDPSPLAPPSAPFARRSISPHPYPEMHPMTSPGGNQYSGSYPQPQSYSNFHDPPPVRPFPGQPLGLTSHIGYQPSRLQNTSSPLSLSPNTNKSNTSLHSASIHASNKTISAAAFKRPRNKSIGDYDAGISPRGLPNSPYPPSRVVSGTAGQPPFGGNMIPPPLEENRMSHASYEFDYIDAYMSPSAPGTPQKGEFPATSRISGGYGTGKFSTDLEGGLR